MSLLVACPQNLSAVPESLTIRDLFVALVKQRRKSARQRILAVQVDEKVADVPVRSVAAATKRELESDQDLSHCQAKRVEAWRFPMFFLWSLPPSACGCGPNSWTLGKAHPARGHRIRRRTLTLNFLKQGLGKSKTQFRISVRR